MSISVGTIVDIGNQNYYYRVLAPMGNTRLDGYVTELVDKVTFALKEGCGHNNPVSIEGEFYGNPKYRRHSAYWYVYETNPKVIKLPSPVTYEDLLGLK